ncbi:MAG: hypothetical protein IPP13_08230 [Kouleothrix sp.]|jgi:hypothetical protein|nr:hypothetical protein [Kouleothrix sp.]
MRRAPTGDDFDDVGATLVDVLRAGVYEQIWEDAPGVSYGRGCGPPVLPPGASEPFGTLLRQFVGTVGWLGQTTWADPLQFLPQANPDTLALENGTPVPIAAGPGDPTLGDALVQLPPPGHPAATLLQPALVEPWQRRSRQRGRRRARWPGHPRLAQLPVVPAVRLAAVGGVLSVS